MIGRNLGDQGARAVGHPAVVAGQPDLPDGCKGHHFGVRLRTGQVRGRTVAAICAGPSWLAGGCSAWCAAVQTKREPHHQPLAIAVQACVMHLCGQHAGRQRARPAGRPLGGCSTCSRPARAAMHSSLGPARTGGMGVSPWVRSAARCRGVGWVVSRPPLWVVQNCCRRPVVSWSSSTSSPRLACRRQRPRNAAAASLRAGPAAGWILHAAGGGSGASRQSSLHRAGSRSWAASLCVHPQRHTSSASASCRGDISPGPPQRQHRAPCAPDSGPCAVWAGRPRGDEYALGPAAHGCREDSWEAHALGAPRSSLRPVTDLGQQPATAWGRLCGPISQTCWIARHWRLPAGCAVGGSDDEGAVAHCTSRRTLHQLVACTGASRTTRRAHAGGRKGLNSVDCQAVPPCDLGLSCCWLAAPVLPAALPADVHALCGMLPAAHSALWSPSGRCHSLRPSWAHACEPMGRCIPSACLRTRVRGCTCHGRLAALAALLEMPAQVRMPAMSAADQPASATPGSARAWLPQSSWELSPPPARQAAGHSARCPAGLGGPAATSSGCAHRCRCQGQGGRRAGGLRSVQVGQGPQRARAGVRAPIENGEQYGGPHHAALHQPALAAHGDDVLQDARHQAAGGARARWPVDVRCAAALQPHHARRLPTVAFKDWQGA